MISIQINIAKQEIHTLGTIRKNLEIHTTIEITRDRLIIITNQEIIIPKT
jgi:hypothetical protein